MMKVHLESLLSSAFSPTSIDPEEQQHRWVSGPGSGESLEDPAQLIILLLPLLSRGGVRNPQRYGGFKNHCMTSCITEDGLLF